MTNEAHSISRGQYWIFALVATLLFLGWHGYFFNIGDQEEHLPQVYKMFQPEIYPHDYFMVPNEATFSIRFFYKWTVFLCSQIMPVSIACFLLTFICIYFSAWAVSRISGYFNQSPVTALIAPALLLVVFPDYALGDNSFQDNALLCSTISIMFCTLALLQYFRGRYLLMAFFAGMSAWFQVIESLIIFSLLAGLIITHARIPFKNILKPFSLYILTASPMLVPMVVIHLMNRATADSSLYYEALYQIRNPNHYLPSHFPLIVYVKFGLFLFAGFLAAKSLDTRARGFVYRISAIVISGMLVYYVFLEHFNIMITGKTQWFKASIWLTLVYTICIAAATEQLLLRYLTQKVLLQGLKLFCFSIIVLAPLVIFNSKHIPIDRFRHNFTIGNYVKSDLTLMHEWIEQNTATDAVFLVSPNDNSFLCEAKRSLLIGYKAVIHEPYFMIPWADNFQRIYHFDLDTLLKKSPYMAAINGFNTNVYEPLATEKLDFRLDDLSQCQIDEWLGPVVHRQGDLVLTKVTGNQNIRGR